MSSKQQIAAVDSDDSHGEFESVEALGEAGNEKQQQQIVQKEKSNDHSVNDSTDCQSNFQQMLEQMRKEFDQQTQIWEMKQIVSNNNSGAGILVERIEYDTADLRHDLNELKHKVDIQQHLDLDQLQLAKAVHVLEHLNKKMILVNNSPNNWDNGHGHTNLAVSYKTVVINSLETGKSYSISALRGFSTFPIPVFNLNSLYYDIQYVEFKLETPSGLLIGLSGNNCLKNKVVGYLAGTFGVSDSTNFFAESSKAHKIFGSGGFADGQTIGCGLAILQNSESAEAAGCENCIQKRCWIFFTRDGQIWGTPFALPANVPAVLYPTLTFWKSAGTKVTANFGEKPFLYEIPPAKGLCIGGFYCCCQK